MVKEKKKGKDAGPKTFKTVSSAFRAQLDAQLVVDKQEHDVEDCEDVPPKHGGLGHLRNYLTKLVLDKY